MKKGIVSLIIVNWNSKDFIKNCLESVFNQDYKDPIEVIIVDNGSTDGSLEWIEEHYHDRVKIIRNYRNLGFSKAQNIGIHASSGEYVLPLNFDVFLKENFITEMTKALESSQDIGIISGKLFKQNGDGTIPTSRIIDSTGIEFPYHFPVARGENSQDLGQYDKEEYVFGACGAAPLYRRKMLEDIMIGKEFFDEDFSSYVEDVDLCWRAQLMGWKCLYTPKAVAFHIRGVTRLKNPKIQMRYYEIGYRNRYLMIFKNCMAKTLRKYWKIMLKRELGFIRLCLKEHPPDLIFKSLGGALLILPKMISKRRKIMKRVSVSEDYIEKFVFKVKEPW